MKKQFSFALAKAVSLVLALLLCMNFALVASAKVSFTKPISTSSITPEDIDRTDFSGVMLLDMTGDALLYSTGSADEKVPACSSIVTMMTAYLAAVNIAHDTVITCPAGTDGDGIGLEEGVKLTAKDLLAAFLYEKDEDAVNALGTYLDENVYNAAEDRLSVMNKTAVELEMKSTYYANATGEYDPASCTSLKDLMILTEALYSQQIISELLVDETYRISSIDGGFSKTLILESPIEISDALVFVLGQGSSDDGSAVSAVAVGGSRTIAFVLSSDTSKLRYSDTAETLFEFAYDNYSIVDFTSLAASIAEKAEVTVSDITVTGFKLSDAENVKMNETVSRSLASTILNNESAFSVKAESSEVEGDTVKATFTLYYLNTSEIASFEATAEAPDALKELYATPTPRSTSTGYESVRTTPAPEELETEEPKQEENEKSFAWVIYIAIAVAFGLGVIIVAEIIRKKMGQ